MNEAAQSEYDEINLIDLLLVPLKRKKTVIFIVIVAIILSVLYSLHKPNMYTATVRILPSEKSTPGLSGLLSQAGPLGGLAGSLMGASSGAQIQVGILKSRTAADMLINKFKLKDLYEQNFLENTYKILAKRTHIDVSRETEIISISVEDSDPERAAAMANTYLGALDRINRTVNITEGHRKRVFLEGRLKKVKQDLSKAETNLKIFQEKYKLVSLDEQAKAAIEGAAAIKGEIISAQTELEVLRQFGTERQKEAVALKSKVAGLQKQLDAMERGSPDNDTLFIPFKEVPAVGLQLARLMRDAKVQEEVFKLITTQYELAKIEEAKDVNTVQVLDRAVPPDKKSGPKRAVIVVLTTVIAFFFAVFLSFVVEYIHRLKTEDQERYQELLKSIRFRKSRR